MNIARAREIARYQEAYKDGGYGMGVKRQMATKRVLGQLPPGSLLDVGAGRGEGVRIAIDAGHKPVVGVEPVDYLAGGPVIVGVATHLPFNDGSFDTVMCLDVLEHLVAEDIEPALLEMRRVAVKHVFLTASDQPHYYKKLGDLHISKRPLEEWQALFEDIFVGCEIKPLGKIGVSPGWLIRV